jgi:hypothetical protein
VARRRPVPLVHRRPVQVRHVVSLATRSHWSTVLLSVLQDSHGLLFRRFSVDFARNCVRFYFVGICML